MGEVRGGCFVDCDHLPKIWEKGKVELPKMKPEDEKTHLADSAGTLLPSIRGEYEHVQIC